MTLQEKEIREQRWEIQDQMKGILDKAENEGRDLTKPEQKKFDSLNKKHDTLERDLREIMRNKPVTSSARDIFLGGLDTYKDSSSARSGVETWRSISGSSEGQEIKVLSNDRSLQRELGISNEKGLDWRTYMRGRIAGFTDDKSLQAEARTMSTTADSSLVPEPLSAQVIDLARNKARIFNAGARTIPMSSKTLTIAKVTGDASPEWKAENASHTSSDVTTAPLTFTAKTLVASVKMSVELSEDSPNGSQVIQNSLANSLALELDRVALVGSGTDPEPQGIYGATNVQTLDLGTDGAALTDYSDYSNAYQKVLEANGVPRSVIHAPRTFGALDRLTASDGQPLMAPQSYQDLQKLVTSQVPIDLTKGASTDASIALLGDYQQLMVGMRTNLRIEVTRVASDSTNSAWEDLQVWVRAYLRADVQLAHPDHFCVIDGITPA